MKINLGDWITKKENKALLIGIIIGLSSWLWVGMVLYLDWSIWIGIIILVATNLLAFAYNKYAPIEEEED